MDVDRNSRGKKSGNTQEQFEQLLHWQCPWHLKGKHSAWECFNLHETIKASMLGDNPKKKGKDKADDDQDDKSRGGNFQDISKTINIIIGGESSFTSKRAQKLMLREIMSIEPVVPRPLQLSLVPILFSRDDQWTSFSKLGKFPLVVGPVVASIRLTRVLIDGGSGLNLLFASTLKKMGLDITDILIPSKAPFTITC
jgi:hypothetical protein